MNGSTPHIPPVVLAWQETTWLSLTVLIFLTWWAYFARRKADDFTLAETYPWRFHSHDSPDSGNDIPAGLISFHGGRLAS